MGIGTTGKTSATFDLWVSSPEYFQEEGPQPRNSFPHNSLISKWDFFPGFGRDARSFLVRRALP